MGSPKISIVIPVFNKISYLDEALQSVIHQTMKEIEIICIDDGSTDGSAELLDEYEKKDSRIKVVHKVNEGQVTARKQGVKLASADWIGFVDADDVIELNMYEQLYNQVIKNGVDFISSGIKRFDGDCYDAMPAGCYGDDDMKFVFSNMIFWKETDREGIIANTVTKIYKKSILTETIRDIPTNIHMCEDDCLVFTYLLKCKKIQILHEIYYYYRYVEDSDCRVCTDDYILNLSSYYIYLKKRIEYSFKDSKVLKDLQKKYITLVLSGLNNQMGFDVDFRVSWDFPLLQSDIEKIVIYGAGIRARRCVKAFEKNSRYEIVAIMDRNKEKALEFGYPVCEIDDLVNIEFDRIIISIRNRETVRQVCEKLCKCGVEKNKIIYNID